MSQDPPPQDRRPRSADATDGVPSEAAQARLSDALHDRAEAYRQDASVDLTIVEALLKVDDPAAAARTIDDHREALRAMARDLQVVVADAAVEREAEAVCRAVEADLVGRGPLTSLRRRALTLAGAATIALALILPQARLSPRTILASVERAMAQDEVTTAKERLDAAKTWARTLRAQHAAASRSASAGARVLRDTTSTDVDTTNVAAGAAGATSDSTSTGADVVDLDVYRARRRAQEPTAARPADPTPPPSGPLDERVAPVGVPLQVDVGGDLGDTATPLPLDPDVPHP